MKKNIFLLSICLVVISFIYTLPIFDSINLSRAVALPTVYDTNGYERIGVQIENLNNKNIDTYEYYDFINEAAVKNNLVIYVYALGQSEEIGQYEHTIFVTTNEVYLKERVLLEEGYIDIQDEESMYATYNEKDSGKILQFFGEAAIRISAIQNYEFLGKYLNIINLEGDFIENATNFFNEVSQEFGLMNVASAQHFSQEGSAVREKEILKEVNGSIVIKFAIVLILTVFFCIKVFSQEKKISFYKLDGETNFSIYLKIFLNKYLLYQGIAALLFIGLLYVFYGGNFNTWKILSFITICVLLGFIVLQIIASMMIYLFISYVPVTKAVKGENKLSDLQIFTYIVKFIVIVVIIPIIGSTFEEAKNFIIINYRYNHVYEKLENYYYFGSQGFSQEYDRDIGTENFIELRDKLVKEDGLFSQGRSFFIEDNFDPENLNVFYSVDQFYLSQNQLLNECDINAICIYIRRDNSMDTEDVIENAKTLTRTEIPIQFIHYDDPLPTYSISDLMYNDFMDENFPIIYTPPEERLDGQLNGMIFYHDGGLVSAQRRIDDVFKEFGYASKFRIVSMQSSYRQSYQFYSMKAFQEFIKFCILILAYIFTNRLLIEVDMDTNRKRYKMSKIEGVNPYSFLIYFLKVCSPAVLALFVCILTNRIQDILLVISVVAIIESILYGLYLYKYSNIRRFK